jgi:photosystem II stability/assembly factor-like uncharacterized protein
MVSHQTMKNGSFQIVAAFGLVLSGCVVKVPDMKLPPSATWAQTSAPGFRGKQDDVFFVDSKIGFYVNGAGDVFRTEDGGTTWNKTLSKPGTYWRSIGMLDAQHGFIGNIGTDYFPGVTDATPLYRTDDGAQTVTPVDTGATPIKGLCAIDIIKPKFINAGVLQERVVIHAGGRVGGPAFLLRSLDAGAHWTTLDLSAHIAMITDVKFLSEQVGFVTGGSDANVETSNAVIAMTTDGGQTWKRVYQSIRPVEIIWKISFPTPEVGYATVMHYDPNRPAQVLAKTMDGGKTWSELPLTQNAAAREFGVGFVTPDIGWVGTGAGGFQTVDGGRTFTAVNLGKVANKIRILRQGTGFLGAAVGTNVFLLNALSPQTPAAQ